MANFYKFKRVGTNLYKAGKKYFRLFGKGITPNGCYIIAPKLKELRDIDVASGNDIWGDLEVNFSVIGSVSSGPEYIYY